MIDEAPVQLDVKMSSRGDVIKAVGISAALYFLYACVIALVNFLSPKFHPLVWVLMGLFSTIAYLTVVLVAIKLMSGLQISRRLDWGLALASLVLYLALNPHIWQAVGLLMQGTGFLDMFSKLSVQDIPTSLNTVISFFFIITSAFFGRLLARIIRERTLLMPVSLVAGMIDFWGVYWGPVNFMSNATPAVVSGIGSATSVAVTAPPEAAINQLSAPLAALAKIAPPQMIGLGDFVFIAFFLACAYRFGLSVKKTLVGILIGMVLASIVMGLDGSRVLGLDVQIAYLPGLVFICGGVLLANIGSWRLTRHEWAMTTLPVVLIGALISYSIVRVELDKPYEKTFSMITDSPQNALRDGLRRVKEGELVILQEQYIYQISGDKAVLQQCQALAIRRQKSVKPEMTWELVSAAVPDDGPQHWQVLVNASKPPAQALLLLAGQPSKIKKDSVALLRSAQGLPESAYAVLDQVDAIAAEMRGQRAFVLILRPDKAIVSNPLKGKVKELWYEPPMKSN